MTNANLNRWPLLIHNPPPLVAFIQAECRDFSLPAAILHELGVGRVCLLTNNPRKVRAMSDAGIEVVERLPWEAAPTPHSLAYLRAKKDKMGHALSLGWHETASDPNDTEIPSEFASIETAIRELRAGRMVVVVDDEDGHKAIRYPQLVALLIEALKEQGRIVDDLSRRVDSLTRA